MHICISENTETVVHVCSMVFSNKGKKARDKELNLGLRPSSVDGSKKEAHSDSLCQISPGNADALLHSADSSRG